MDEKMIRLVPQTAYFNHMKVEVQDFPQGIGAMDESGNEILRRRCEIDIEYSEADLKPLINDGKDLDAAIEYYKNWMYALIKRLISSDWTAESGLEETLTIVREKIKDNF